MRLERVFSFVFFSRAGAPFPAASLLAAFLLATPCAAQADEPFDLEIGDWMSFDRYKHSPSDWKSKEEKAKNPVIAPVMPPAPVLPPVRDVVAPVMPGLNIGVNKGFDVRVDSTLDDQSSAARLTGMEDRPDLQLPATSWQNAAEAAKYGLKKDGAHGPLDVRLTYLPRTQAAKQAKKPKQEEAPATATAAPKKDDDKAARAALEAYKKQQLEALESDRRTLQALQEAIKQLGLQKELNFLTGASASVGGDGAGEPMPLVELPPLTPPATAPAPDKN